MPMSKDMNCWCVVAVCSRLRAQLVYSREGGVFHPNPTRCQLWPARGTTEPDVVPLIHGE
jgi:hypothetical protein